MSNLKTENSTKQFALDSSKLIRDFLAENGFRLKMGLANELVAKLSGFPSFNHLSAYGRDDSVEISDDPLDDFSCPDGAYKAYGFFRCPYCTSGEIEPAGRLEMDGPEGTWDQQCLSCGATWTDYMAVVGSTDFEEGSVPFPKAPPSSLKETKIASEDIIQRVYGAAQKPKIKEDFFVEAQKRIWEDMGEVPVDEEDQDSQVARGGTDFSFEVNYSNEDYEDFVLTESGDGYVAFVKDGTKEVPAFYLCYFSHEEGEESCRTPVFFTGVMNKRGMVAGAIRDFYKSKKPAKVHAKDMGLTPEQIAKKCLEFMSDEGLFSY